MADHKKPLSEQVKEATMQKLWLTYYNETLYAKGIISEAERNRMKLKINLRTASAAR